MGFEEVDQVFLWSCCLVPLQTVDSHSSLYLIGLQVLGAGAFTSIA